MTERIQALTVALDRDIREDDVRALIDAILHLPWVVGVATHVAGLDAGELHKQLLDVLYPKQTSP